MFGKILLLTDYQQVGADRGVYGHCGVHTRPIGMAMLIFGVAGAGTRPGSRACIAPGDRDDKLPTNLAG